MTNDKTIYGLQPAKCTSWLGHKFQGRYSHTETAGPLSSRGGEASHVIRAIEAAKCRSDTYHCDVCVRCGLVINFQGNMTLSLIHI